MLLLDEPTNDLDVDTLRALETGLESFPGCAVVISHDRWFLDRIATHVLAFEGDSQVRWFEGNFTEYEAWRHKELGSAADQPHRIKYKPLACGPVRRSRPARAPASRRSMGPGAQPWGDHQLHASYKARVHRRARHGGRRDGWRATRSRADSSIDAVERPDAERLRRRPASWRPTGATEARPPARPGRRSATRHLQDDTDTETDAELAIRLATQAGAAARRP